MKKNIFTLFLTLVFAVSIKAQSITPTSTAEECIAFIDAAAKSFIGVDKSYPLTYASFTGTGLQKTINLTSLDFKHNFLEIDWAYFKSITKMKPDGGKIPVYYFFEKIKKENTTINVDTGIIQDYEFEETSYFWFYIPESEQSKLKDLEAAGKRLAEIATAKESTLLVVRKNNLPKEGTPSYEETVAYIETYFDDPNKKGDGTFLTTTLVLSGTYLGEDKYSILYVDIMDCTLKIGWKLIKIGPNFNIRETKIFNREIDLSKVESIQPNGRSYNGDEGAVWFMNFIEKNKAHSEEFDLPVLRTRDNELIMNDLKIYKAFNHLRKLCGAPEPISFD